MSQKTATFIQYNSLRLDGDVKQCVNFLLESFSCRMFETRKGKLYLLLDHWKYLEWYKAQRVRIGATKMKDGFYYQTATI